MELFLLISPRQGVISFKKKKKEKEYRIFKELIGDLHRYWMSIIKLQQKPLQFAWKDLAESIIHPCQTGYVNGRFIGESIRLIADIMGFNKQNDIPGGFWISKKRSTQSNGISSKSASELLTSVQISGSRLVCFTKISLVALKITGTPQNNSILNAVCLKLAHFHFRHAIRYGYGAPCAKH